MKSRNIYLNIILFLLIINVFTILKVNAASNPYNEKGPYGTNCTWYAWKMANEKAGVSLPGWRDAKNWYIDAKDDGYNVGTTPKANSIIVWGDWTSYGHVGYVESVEGNILYVWDSTGPCIDEDDQEYIECMANSVSEETDKACKINAKKEACEYDISSSNYTITGYIYLDNAPKKSTTSNSKNTNTTQKEENTADAVTQKSNNANLSNIELSVGIIKFDKEVNEYRIEVENEFDKITINATTEDDKSLVNGTGDYNLNVGLNEIKLVVTAEDNSTKDYLIQIARKEKIEEDLELDTTNNIPEEEQANYNSQMFIIVLCICSIIILVVSLILVFKKKLQHSNKKL